MKRFRLLYLLAFSTLFVLMACQRDDTTEQDVGLQSDGTVRVHLKVGVAGSNSTRADDDWADNDNAATEEMMNVWTVVVVNNANDKVVSIWACKPQGKPDQEIDREVLYEDYVELPAVGTYRFYSFANMSPDVVKDLCLDHVMVDPGTVRTRGDNDPTTGNDPTTNGNNTSSGANAGTRYQCSGDATGTVRPYWTQNDRFFSDDDRYPKNTVIPIPFDNDATVTASIVNSMAVNIAGNNFDVTGNNGYGAVGIPMSNVQTITIGESTTTVELIVVRMMAKIEVDVYNDGDNDATINSISLTDITKNADANLKLLPSFKSTSGPNTMEVVDPTQNINYHQDIQPNLSTVATRGNMSLYPTAAEGLVEKVGHKTNLPSGTPDQPVKFTFYVNESTAPDNGSGLFYLSLGIKTGTGDDVVYSHALISNTAADEWSYIARNDFRKIRVILTDWLFRIEPISLAPIAGYPDALLSSDAQKATFSAGGLIALKPYVKKRTESYWRDFSDTEVNFVDIHWINSDGTDVSGDDKIVKQAFTYDSSSRYIIGELNQDRVTTGHTNKTAITITVKLGPTGSQFTYSFTCDVII